MKNPYIIILLLMIWGSLYSQQFTNYSTKNGLPSNHVYRITQDINGFIWFITDKGMVKYNGTDFKSFTIRDGLPTNDIWNITPTPNGRVWYFSKSPKIGYIDKDSVYAFPSTIKGEILNPRNRNIVGNDISFQNSFNHYELKNNEWKSHKVFYFYSKNKYYRAYLKHRKLNVFQYSKTTNDIVFINKKGKIEHKISNNKIVKNNHTRGQINDSTFLWLSNLGYTTINLNNFNIKTCYFKDKINLNKFKYVRVHVLNNKIQITGEGFVSILDNNYNILKTHYISKKLKSHFSFIDKQDNLWIATFRNGVYKLPKSKQKVIYTLNDEKVGAIKKIDNKLIVPVLDKGFYQYDTIKKQFIPYVKETNFTFGVFSIKELSKNYFITNRAIFTLDTNLKYILHISDENSHLNEIARRLVFHKGYLYGNFTSGLNKLNPENFNIKKKYIFNGIRTFISFKNELVIASSNGLKIIKDDSIKSIKFKNKTPNNLHKKPILSLTKIDENYLLVGTDAYGAFITNLDQIIPLKGTEYLSINNSYVESNNIWLATDKGVWHYKKQTDKEYGFIALYNENNGLLLNNTNSVYTTNKNLIISSNIGVVTIPKKKTNKQELLDIYITKVKFNGEKLTDVMYYIKNNTFNFSVATINFSETSNFLYEYQLLPLQNKWITTSSKEISFNDLPPNNYIINIKYRGISNSISFEILPLWYQTWIAKILLGLLYVLIISGLIAYFISRELKKRSKLLKSQKKLAAFELHALRSQMNPHFVFNSLNAIQCFITKNEIDLSEKYLVKFSRLIRMFFDFSREKEITLSKEIKLLNSYLEIEKMRFGNDFKFQFYIDHKLNLNENKIPTMLLQPIVENAVNHGLFHNEGKGLIEITFNSVKDKTYQVIIKDNGVGIERSRKIQEQSLKRKSKSGANSTDVINERIELLNQSNLWSVDYEIIDNSKTVGGTSVQLTFKKNE